MSVLRPMDKLPDLNGATILLVGTEDALLQRLAESMLKDHCASESLNEDLGLVVSTSVLDSL